MNYKDARNATWSLLIKHGIDKLPVDVMAICKAEHIPVFTYRTGRNFIEKLNLEEHIADNDAFSVCGMIFYDDTKPPRRQRFSIAHELGHIILHTDFLSRVCWRSSTECNDPMEAEANIFASRLLAPLCVLQYLNVNSAKDISELCDISYSAARNRYARLCDIRKRNSVRLHEKNHGTFLLSPLERKVTENFMNFIEENKRYHEIPSKTETSNSE